MIIWHSLTLGAGHMGSKTGELESHLPSRADVKQCQDPNI